MLMFDCAVQLLALPPLLQPSCPQRLLERLEEIISEWNSELQERTGKFRKQANAVAEWDKRILHNQDVLLGLEIEAAKVAETDSYLELQLELIETHQQESIEDDTERTFKDERGFLVDDDAASTRDAI
ncbi:hypothetical protein MLD38_038521 [Melastoma candidum]|uniref:Uncharacterized protein n=1 Tax=Melastoma candidum TaxID=119954 RepID=A0ACB9KZU7_9MYRT|nr:hypothetical protein MLD38_038521 [Melastoma candidum]